MSDEMITIQLDYSPKFWVGGHELHFPFFEIPEKYYGYLMDRGIKEWSPLRCISYKATCCCDDGEYREVNYESD